MFDFTSIHPFNDGNGRMSRLLMLLLLYKNGYNVGKYVSIEREIEQSKETYYEALAASSQGWGAGRHSYVPFVRYMLGVVLACYRALDAKVAIAHAASSEEGLYEYFSMHLGGVSKQEILDDNPFMSQRTLERCLQKMQAEGTVKKLGAARYGILPCWVVALVEAAAVAGLWLLGAVDAAAVTCSPWVRIGFQRRAPVLRLRLPPRDSASVVMFV